MMTVGLGLRALLQGILFILVARMLGAQGYGEFVAVLAIVSLFTPFVGVGAAALLVRETARRPEVFAKEFGRGLLLIGATSLPLLALALSAAFLFLPAEISRELILMIALAEVLCMPIVDFAARAYQAFERMARMAAISAGLILLRLIGFGGMLLGADLASPELWAAWYLFMSALAAALSVLLAAQEVGRPRFHLTGGWAALREGFYFALGGASGKVHADIDKAMLARLDSIGAAGIYSAAYRFMDMLMLPIYAFLGASLARFFRAGENGTASSGRYALRLLPVPFIYAVLAGLLLFSLADLIPWLLGPSFGESVTIARWFALLPLLMLFRFFLSTVAGVSGYHRFGCAVITLGAAVNVVANLGLIPSWGWRGALAATFTAESVMIAVLLWKIRWQSGYTDKSDNYRQSLPTDPTESLAPVERDRYLDESKTI